MDSDFQFLELFCNPMMSPQAPNSYFIAPHPHFSVPCLWFNLNSGPFSVCQPKNLEESNVEGGNYAFFPTAMNKTMTDITSTLQTNQNGISSFELERNKRKEIKV